LAQLACTWEIYLYFGVFAAIGMSPTLPAGIDGAVPEDCTEVLVALNVIGYGLSRDLLKQITSETVACLDSRFREKLVIEAI
jgi:hypothetical protein